MRPSYNQIAGRSVETSRGRERPRIRSRGDAACAGPSLPPTEAIHHEQDLWRALGAFVPRLTMCAMSFLAFGLAPWTPSSASEQADAPALTQENAIMGTAGYMRSAPRYQDLLRRMHLAP